MKLNIQLKPGDIVDVIAPAWTVPSKDIKSALAYLQQRHLVPRIPRSFIQKTHFHSNEDLIRFQHLKKALLSQDSQIVWCLRGGYGSNRLLPYLSQLKKPKHKKILIGLSDITSLHLFLNQEWDWPTLHAPVLDRMAKAGFPKKYEKELWQLLWGETLSLEYTLKPMNASAQKVKTLSAPIVGGNLTVLQSSLATPYQLDPKNKILFIEEVGERGYRVDRMLEQFLQSGLFEKCLALIVGPLIGGEEPGTKKALTRVAIQRFAKQNLLPVYEGVPSGHGEYQRVLPLNYSSKIVHKNNRVKLIL